jgi:phage terminase small subunit
MTSSKVSRKGWRRLTARQQKFLELLLGAPADQRNAAQAYRAAYGATSASPETVSRLAQRLMKNEKLAPIIAAADRRAAAKVEAMVDRYAATQERIVGELARIGFANVIDYAKIIPGGHILEQLTRDEAAAISEITVEELVDVGEGKPPRRRTFKLKLHNKATALVDLARIQGLIVARTEISGIGGGPIETKSEGPTEFGRDIFEQRFLEISRRREAARQEEIEAEVARRLAMRERAKPN